MGFKGKKEKLETRKKKSLMQRGKSNSNWKGNKVKRTGLHHWIERQLGGRPKLCSKCRKKGWIDLANINHSYKRDLKEWMWLCRKCHMIFDKRMEKFKANRFIGNTWKNIRYN